MNYANWQNNKRLKETIYALGLSEKVQHTQLHTCMFISSRNANIHTVLSLHLIFNTICFTFNMKKTNHSFHFFSCSETELYISLRTHKKKKKKKTREMKMK